MGLALLALLCLPANLFAGPVAQQRDPHQQTRDSSGVTEITRLNQQVVMLVNQGKLDEA